MSHAFRTLHQAMPIVAAALGRQFGVPVAVGGDEACTDGHSIQVPALPPQSELIPVAWGYLAHEAAHLRFTDFDAYRQGSGSDPLSRSVLNILEDIRIERAIAVPYPGTRETLLAVCDHLSGRGDLSPPKPDAHPAQVLTSYLLLHLRHRLLATESLAASAREAERVLREVFPLRTVHRLQGLLTEVGQLANTGDTVDLAKRIRALLEAEKPPARAPSSGSGTDQPDQPGHAGQNVPGTAGRNHPTSDGGSTGTPTDANAAGADDSLNPTAGQSSPGNAAGDHPSGQGQGQGQKQGTDGTTSVGPGGSASSTKPDSTPPPTLNADAPADVGKAQAIAQALSASDDDLPGDLFQQVRELLDAAGQGDSPCLLPRAEPFESDPTRGLRLLATVQEESRRLRARLQGLVQASRLDRPQAFRHGPRLLPKRLYRAAVGDPRLFARKRERVAVDTAIHLLIDLSGSMNSPVRRRDGLVQRRGQIAQSAALALALALDGIHGVSVAVSAFPGLSGVEDRISVLVRHGQRPRACAGAFLQSTRGGTPMAGALWFAAADLLGRPESRRIVLLLTDGKPNRIAETREILRLCSAAGLETVGLGIGVDVSGLFPVALRVDEVTELRTALFGAAERLLLAA
ncbi:Nitric oxide reductase activation protein [Thiorhodovibrio winogradskyi]|uniref:Nitric oxide reductase activation protein n=1 Tax=Thiorhodovibrio winogradskyi TaxID=77007 RepID=A0ABZ0SAG3_9GAMM|nr:VWA domain-containing protein [Thiorhodovibrio winogradskyi]